MIDCSNGDIRDLLPDLLHDRLAPATLARVESHVASCAACQDELSLLSDLRATIRRAPSVSIGAIASAVPAYRAPTNRGWESWRAAAAILVIAAGATSFAIVNRRETPPPVAVAPVPAPPGTVAATQSPELVMPRSPDGAAGPATPAPSLAPTIPSAPIVAGRELAMVGGADSDLSDGELSTLLNELESIDLLPSAEVEGVRPMSPLQGAQ